LPREYVRRDHAAKTNAPTAAWARQVVRVHRTQHPWSVPLAGTWKRSRACYASAALG